MNAADAKMFSIYMTDFQTDFIGDIREVDAAERRADILAHSIHFVNVDQLLNTPAQPENERQRPEPPR